MKSLEETNLDLKQIIFTKTFDICMSKKQKLLLIKEKKSYNMRTFMKNHILNAGIYNFLHISYQR